MFVFFQPATILSAAANVWLFITCARLTLLFIYLAKYYLKSSREIRRLEAVTCSPVYSLIADTVAGLEVIRSSEMEDDFLQKFYKLVLIIDVLRTDLVIIDYELINKVTSRY